VYNCASGGGPESFILQLLLFFYIFFSPRPGDCVTVDHPPPYVMNGGLRKGTNLALQQVSHQNFLLKKKFLDGFGRRKNFAHFILC
jgi:hypothetical protein